MELGIIKDRNDEVSPWHEAFVNARKWMDKKIILI
jgi:phosphoribosylformylglycinamidine synthase